MGTHLKRFDQHISKQLIMQKTNSCDKIIKLDCGSTFMTNLTLYPLFDTSHYRYSYCGCLCLQSKNLLIYAFFLFQTEGLA